MNQSLITIQNCYIFNKIKLKLKIIKIINYLIHFIKKFLLERRIISSYKKKLPLYPEIKIKILSFYFNWNINFNFYF